MSNHKSDQILQLTGFALGIPVRYLGVPLSRKWWKRFDCNALMERITKRIRCWTSGTLLMQADWNWL